MARNDIYELLNGKCGYIGLYENIWPETLSAWQAQGLNDCADACLRFGFDIGRLGGAFDPQPVPGFTEVIEDTPEYRVTADSFGVTRKTFKHNASIPGAESHKMNTCDVWQSAYKPELFKHNDRRIPAESLSKKLALYTSRDRWTCFNMTFVWEMFRQSVGDVTMYEALIDDPGWVRDFNETLLCVYKANIQKAIDLVGKPDGFWFSEDLAYNGGLFCSPKVLRELYLPVYAQLNEFLHGLGMKVILHSCGNINQALPIIVEAGFDALHPLQVKAGCEPLKIAAQYRAELAFLGGLDLHIIESNDKARIKTAMESLINGMRELNARYIFASDHSISPNVLYSTYEFILENFYKLAGR